MRKSFLGMFALSIGVLFFMSCGSAKDAATLLSGRWQFAEVNGDPVVAEKVPFVEYDAAEKRLFGNAGCNNFNAGVQFDESNPAALTILPGGATMMACPDMETEDKILKSLDKVASVKASGNGLELLDKSGSIVFLLTKSE